MVPEVTHNLYTRLFSACQLDSIAAKLRDLRQKAPPVGPAGPSSFPSTDAEKKERMHLSVSLWNDLRDQTFLLATAASWLLPAVTLLVHIQLAIVCRSSYLEQIFRTHRLNSVGLPTSKRKSTASQLNLQALSMATLTDSQQQAFLRCGSFLLDYGLKQTLHRMQIIVKKHVSDLALQKNISLNELFNVLSSIHEEVNSTFDPMMWVDALLPPIIQEESGTGVPVRSLSLTRASPVGTPPLPVVPEHSAEAVFPESPCTGSSYRGNRVPNSSSTGSIKQTSPQVYCTFPPLHFPAGLDGTAAEGVAKLVLEARQVIGSRFYVTAFQDSVKYCAAMVAESLKGQFQVQSNRGGTVHGVPLKMAPGVIPSHAANQNSAAEANGAQPSGHVMAGQSSDASDVTVCTAWVVGSVKKSAEEILGGKTWARESICQLDSVRALLDATFACGPFLDFQDLRL